MRNLSGLKLNNKNGNFMFAPVANSCMFAPALNTLGHPMREEFSIEQNLMQKKFALVSLANVLGYIPIIGTVVGIARIIFASLQLQKDALDEFEAAFYKTQIARGSIELISCGAIILPIDIILTVARLCILAKHPSAIMRMINGVVDGNLLMVTSAAANLGRKTANLCHDFAIGSISVSRLPSKLMEELELNELIVELSAMTPDQREYLQQRFMERLSTVSQQCLLMAGQWLPALLDNQELLEGLERILPLIASEGLEPREWLQQNLPDLMQGFNAYS